jgi:hypothetical protein
MDVTWRGWKGKSFNTMPARDNNNKSMAWVGAWIVSICYIEECEVRTIKDIPRTERVWMQKLHLEF